MFLKYIDDDEKWLEFLNYKIYSLYSYRKEKNEFNDFILNKKYKLITEKIKSNSYHFSIPKKVYISKGNSNKKRVVYKFNNDEVIILKYISYLLYEYDFLFCDNLYSFRKSITMKDAIYKIRDLLKDKKMYAYKVDISNYFNSIDNKKILSMLKNELNDEALYSIIEDIIVNDYVIYNDEKIIENKGILAGCPISAFLANYYLKDLDKYFYDNNVNYFRYSDDIIIFSEDKDILYKYSNLIKNKLSLLNLKINIEKEFYYNIGEAIDFLGFSFRDDSIDISSNSIYKAKKRIKRSARYIRRLMIEKNIDGNSALKLMIRKNNKKFYGNKREELSWKYWFFPIINSTFGLKIIDQYFQNELRYLITGKHNKKNYKIVPYETLKNNGYKSLVHEYYLFIKTLKN